MPSTTLKETLNRLRVRAGLFLALAVILLARPTWSSILLGILISFLGLVIRAWASGHLRKEKALAVSGPYRYSRNPLYLGNFLLGIGITAGARSWWVLGLCIAYYAVFYPMIIRRERERMKDLFPRQYEDYGKKVPLFFPSPRKHLPANGRFSWFLYRQNKEYRALLGTILVWLVLAAKLLLLKQ
ncbi:MAG TPA: isoprenylcysteine carboxylmethyltransferase family protein [Candidatus Desulfaltia sp.]|nr:isoprenylcysteine carboxylmethyltransferase family protein [Candidatus Desulfaltia sp.]